MVKEILIKCYEKKRSSNQILNEKDITSLRKGVFSGVFGKWGNWKLKSKKYQSNILFGLKSGIIFYEREVLFIIDRNKIEDKNYNSKTYPILDGIRLSGKNLEVKYGYDWYLISLSKFDYEFFRLFYKNYRLKSSEKDKKKLVREVKIKQNKEIKLKKNKTSIINKLDKDNNGLIDIIEENNEFSQLLKKHQKVIIENEKEFNENYIQQFVRIGDYLKDKRNNLQSIFNCIKNVENEDDLKLYVDILENDIYSYNLLLLNSLNLLVTLIEGDRITFYEIHQKFDKLNIFNSNWENEMSQKLTKINLSVKGLMSEIRVMGDRIVSSIDDLSFITEESKRVLDNRLGEINSSIDTNNLLTLINTYQTYKINQNTKSLK